MSDFSSNFPELYVTYNEGWSKFGRQITAMFMTAGWGVKSLFDTAADWFKSFF